MESELQSDICVICKKSLDFSELTTIGEKGKTGIENAAKAKKDTISVNVGQKVHIDCRRKYIHPRQPIQKRKSCSDATFKHLQIGSVSNFSIEDHCLFCEESIEKTCRQKDFSQSYSIKSAKFQSEILEKSKERNDGWGHEVMAKIHYYGDLCTSSAVYHQTCSVRFRKGRDKAQTCSAKAKKMRVTEDKECNTEKEEAFLKVIQFLEKHDNKQFTLTELVKKMGENLSESNDSYSVRHMRRRLEEYFGDDLIVTSGQGKENIITFKKNISSVLYGLHKQEIRENENDEKVIKAAADLIKSDIRKIISKNDEYPSPLDVEKSIEFIPESLHLFLSSIVTCKNPESKIAAIGQAIIQAARPRLLIMPLQIGLGVQLHQHYASRFLIDTLHNLGFCSSYKEVQRYEQNAAVSNDSDRLGCTTDQFIQYVADNVDHNIQTIDGHGTFHGMGIIAAATPEMKIDQIISRHTIPTSELKKIGKINIHFYNVKQRASLVYRNLPDFSETSDETESVDILWKTTWLFRTERSSWNGTMQMIHKDGEYPGKSAIVFMPMIDLNPNDESCIYSTLVWVSNHAKRYSVTPVVTFDQPLWYKANLIVSSEPSASELSKVVVRLGAFHTEMSFLGSIGYIMTDSGLSEALSTVYAEKAVGHMLSGKAISRAFRGHGLVYMALQSIIISDVFKVGFTTEQETDDVMINIHEYVSFDNTDEKENSDNPKEKNVKKGEIISADKEERKSAWKKIETGIGGKCENVTKKEYDRLPIEKRLNRDTDNDQVELNDSYNEASKSANEHNHQVYGNENESGNRQVGLPIVNFDDKQPEKGKAMPGTTNTLYVKEKETFGIDRGNVKENIPENDMLECYARMKKDTKSEREYFENVVDITDGIDKDLKVATELFDQLTKGEIGLDEVKLNPTISNIKRRTSDYCKTISEKSRTAKLWTQYCEMVELLHQFIKAERTGNWELHLKSLRSMLPFFAASGHNLYAKSVYLYLLKMNDLKISHPELHAFFMKGHHVIRRSDRYWAGLSTDLVIEQVLMRSLKCTGGLTRGSGMTDIQRAVWVLSRPATSAMNNAMQIFSGEIYTANEQHCDTFQSVRKRDAKDIGVITEYLNERHPFKGEQNLRSLTTGVISYDSNAEVAKEIGETVVSKLKGKRVDEYTFKKKDCVIPMNDKSAVTIDGDTVKIDPQLLFQRLLCAARRCSEFDEDETPISYELCAYPPALFERPGYMREADKPSLANTLKTIHNPARSKFVINENLSYVVDGGMLLQWIPWESGKTFEQICLSYSGFLATRYSKSTVVFDGYENGPSTKDNTHDRRNTGMVGAEVKCNRSSIFRGKKKLFLANFKNKQRFINLLAEHIEEVGIKTRHAASDADLLIVQTAVESSMSNPTILVGDDTDLLVLLCYHASLQSHPLFLNPRQKLHKEEMSWDILQLKRNLGEELCMNLLFIHAILGCDTTSKVFGLGKGLAMKAFQDNTEFRRAALVFLKPVNEVIVGEIVKNGEKAISILYKGHPEQSLDNLREARFDEKVTKSSIYIDPKSLPPTSDAAQFHSMRVYLQVQDWKGDDPSLNPTDWGWNLVGERYIPITMTKGPAPQRILKVIRCTCSRGCRTKACSCKKFGIECSSSCSHCKGVSCENAISIDMTES